MDRQANLFDVAPLPWEMDEQDDFLLAEVVFARAPFGPYDYLVPTELRGDIAAGCRVEVPLGHRTRRAIGYCVSLRDASSPEAPIIDPRRLKKVQRVLDRTALVPLTLLRLSLWISRMYLCPLGPVLETVIPPGVRGSANMRQIKLVQLSATARAENAQPKVTDLQRRIVDSLRHTESPVPLHDLLHAHECTAAPIHTLRRRGLIELITAAEERQTYGRPAVQQAPPELILTEPQQAAVHAIEQSMGAEQHQTFLLHGITGSGKTEVYIRSIETVVSYGRQAIVLVPEISLTPQTRQRFECRFSRVAVLHSNLTVAERAWHWRRIANGEVDVVIGARSAVFAPVPRLGLIVIDEEHDGSFKQDKAPRYHARDVARWRAESDRVPLILGSATPALESWLAAREGRMQLLSLPQRVSQRSLPAVKTIDLRIESTKRKGRGVISPTLHRAISGALAEGGQVILLLNRRGYSTSVQCPACGGVVYCSNCAIAMTHHRDRHLLMCHYCDAQQPEPQVCPDCGFAAIRFTGVGTQRLEAEVRARFPDATCLRMDTDSMKRPGSHERALDEFRRGSRRILLGTQMIAKGLDFPNVTLVGVINADTALHREDFRAAERTFSLVTQVAGRTGRGPRGGCVYVQTFSPEHPAIACAVDHDYVRFAEAELQQRQPFGYPPWGRLVRFLVRSEHLELAKSAAEALAGEVAAAISTLQQRAQVIGPAQAPINRLRGKFRFHFLVRFPHDVQPADYLAALPQEKLQWEDVQWVIDVDPQELM